jgi:hypothetical protein
LILQFTLRGPNNIFANAIDDWAGSKTLKEEGNNYVHPAQNDATLNRFPAIKFWREISTFNFYELHSGMLDIYYLQKVKNHKTIELERLMELSINSMHNTTINHKSNTTIY